MKIIHVNFSDFSGGAAVAVSRISQAINSKSVTSEIIAINKKNTQEKIDISLSGIFFNFTRKIKNKISNLILKIFLKSNNQGLHSLAFFNNSSTLKKINQSNADIVNLHWINAEMLSIENITKINYPVVWTLHDMWPFSGAEHYPNDTRWKYGYFKKNKLDARFGIDLNLIVWKKKLISWKKPIYIVVNCNYMHSLVKQSYLMRHWPVTLIPNPIDTNFWRPQSKIFSRRRLNIPVNKKYILFFYGSHFDALRKGNDLLFSCLSEIKLPADHYEILLIGKDPEGLKVPNKYKVNYFPHTSNIFFLKLIYNAADLVLILSRQETLINVGVEAHSCGIPIVAFNVGGLSDIVEHKATGYLAKPFDVHDIAKGIHFIFSSKKNSTILATSCRKKALREWAFHQIGKKYINLYKMIISQSFQE